MQQSRFSVLTGHLNDYPLGDLVGILRHQQKTGRLLIEYSKGPAMLFFKDGELVDAQLDKLSGLQAICVALAQSPASFNFNPLIHPSRRSIERSLQKAVSELLGCWDENAIEIEKIVPEVEKIPPARETEAALLTSAAPGFDSTSGPTSLQAPSFLSLPPAPASNRYSPPVMAMAAAGLLMLGLSTLIGVSGRFGNTALSASSSKSSSPVIGEVAQPTGPEAVKTGRLHESKARREVPKAMDRAATSKQLSSSESQISSKPEGAAVGLGRSDDASSATASPVPGEGGKRVEGTAGSRSVKVVLQVSDGRVTQASIGNHRPGMDAYEALALRIARQRRYPSKMDGQEIVTIKVSQPE